MAYINKNISILTSLYRGETFLKDFLIHLNKIERADECEVILVHNDPTEEEEAILTSVKLNVALTHIKVPREGLYTSWNRGIMAAKGKYIAIWNIDDVRLPDSLINQADALDGDERAQLCIGNFIIIDAYGKTAGKFINVPDFFIDKKSLFFRRHHGGSFIMWKRELHEKFGYFDEQFRLVADLDFQIRIAKLSSIVKVNKPLGFFLAGEDNLSNNYKLQDAENTAIHLRYNNFDLVNIPSMPLSLKIINIKMYKWFGQYVPVMNLLNHDVKEKFLKFPSIVVALYRFPRHFARKYFK